MRVNVELKSWAEAERMIPDAPVETSRSITIGASVDTVWHLLTGVADWPRWHGYLRNARLDGTFAAGTALTYGGLFKHRLRVAKVKPRQFAMLYGTLAGYTGITRWDVKSIASAPTEGTFSESSDGPLIAFLYGSDRLGKHLENWLTALKMEAERRTG